MISVPISALISVDEAIAKVLAFGEPYGSEEVALEEAGGRVLREAVKADREYPAQDRSRMDGIAVTASAWDEGVRAFPVLGMARAGDPRGALGDSRGCFEIMTGAPVPLGADAVIPYEEVTIENGVATVRSASAASPSVVPGHFIHKQGSDCAQGEVLVEAGERLSAVRIAAAASMGYERLQVTRRPRISILTTGDELVEVGATPAAHQVRASNGHALRALLQGLGPVRLDSVGDDRAALRDRLESLLQVSDIVLLTGGVSAGKFDEVPGVLRELGVEEVFHKVAQRPGKPLWFGIQGRETLVFGLPGNPVSSLVCARRYVVPLLQAKSGAVDRSVTPNPKVRLSARTAGESIASTPSRLTRFVPVRLDTNREAMVTTVNGSGDFSGLGRSDGFVEIPPSAQGEGNAFSALPAGELLSFFGWDS